MIRTTTVNATEGMPSESVTTAIISPDPAIHRHLQEALSSGSVTEAIWSLPDYPELPALERLTETQSGCVLFLDFVDVLRARRIAAELDRAQRPRKRHPPSALKSVGDPRPRGELAGRVPAK